MMMFNLVNLRKAIVGYQVVLAIAGLVIAIMSLTLLVTAPIMAIAPQNVLVGGLVLGIILIFVCAIGAFGVMDETGKSPLVGYLLLMIAVLAVTIWGNVGIGSLLKETSVEERLDRVWMQSDTATILQIESWGQCCGFHNYTDRIQEPCTKYQQELGCFELMRGQYQSRLAGMLAPSLVLLVGELGGVALITLILWLEWREGRKAKMVGDRQPFEAWHKAVFQ